MHLRPAGFGLLAGAPRDGDGNLAQGGFCTLGALLARTLHVFWHWPLVAAVPTTVLLTVAAGSALGAAAFVPGLGRLSNSNMLKLTAGLLAFIDGVLLIVWGGDPFTAEPFSGGTPVPVGGLLVATQSFRVVGTALLTMGERIRAMAERIRELV